MERTLNWEFDFTPSSATNLLWYSGQGTFLLWALCIPRGSQIRPSSVAWGSRLLTQDWAGTAAAHPGSPRSLSTQNVIA